jgi:acetyl esterase/lipase
MRFNFVGLLIIMLVLVASIGAQTNIETYGVTYRTVDGKELQMDIQQPQPVGAPKPVVVFLCGNGWGYERTINREYFWYALDLANQNGYVAVTVDYSSSVQNSNNRPIGTFPCQIYDVKSAIRFLKARAKQYDIDPTRIGVIGFSSGANLALLLALTAPADGLEGQDDYPQYSSCVQAVVNLSGVTDLAAWNRDPFVSAYLGGSLQAKPEQYKRASPISYVKPGMAPVLTIHGEKDTVVPPDQARLFDARMREVGASHTLIIKSDLTHNDELGQDVWEFLNRYLK